MPAANIYAWFHAAVKRYTNIKKTGPGSYRLVGKAPAAAKAPAKAPAPAKAAAPKKGKRGPAPAKAKGKGKAKGGGGRRGEMREKIIAALKSAGSGGINIKALSSKIGAPYKNLQVWFATTGKKTPGIKKVRPATYTMAG